MTASTKHHTGEYVANDTEGSPRSPASGMDVISGWIWWTGIAMFATLAHILIDAHIGLWGETSDEMSLLQATNAIAQGTLYGWWLVIVVVASHGNRWALRSALLMAMVYAFFLHGVAAFFAAPPPSAAAPYQDIAHGLSLLTGGVAALMIRKQTRQAHRRGQRWLFVVTIALLVVLEVVSTLAFIQNL